MKFLVTGGAGFIGSAFVRMMVGSGKASILNLDKLTYAGNLENLAPIQGKPGYEFVHGDICDAALVNSLVADHKPDAIVHFAAESHVANALDPARYDVEVVHLGQAKVRVAEAERAGVKSVPALVLGGAAYHINFGAGIEALR